MLRDPKKIKNEIVEWIRDYFEKNGKDSCAVIGISGGKDSTICAALCVEALGKDRVIGVLMPNGDQSDINDSLRLVEDILDIRYETINIKNMYDSFCNSNNTMLGILWRTGITFFI